MVLHMKGIVLFFFISLLIRPLTAQTPQFGERFEVGLSAFYYWEDQQTDLSYNYQEMSFSPSFFVNLSPRFYAGIRGYVVRASNRVSPTFSSWHTLVGPTLHFKIAKKERFDLSAEAGYYIGNYCPNCLQNNPHYNSTLHYFGLSASFNFQLLKSTPLYWITVSFATNNVFNVNTLNGYNLPLFGIQYRFGKIDP